MGFNHKYKQTTCPRCNRDLTQNRSVLVNFGNDTASAQGTTRLDAEGNLIDFGVMHDYAEGLLVDNGVIAGGLHQSSLCASCSYSLDTLAEVFDDADGAPVPKALDVTDAGVIQTAVLEATRLLLESAAPFDKACTLLRKAVGRPALVPSQDPACLCNCHEPWWVEHGHTPHSSCVECSNELRKEADEINKGVVDGMQKELIKARQELADALARVRVAETGFKEMVARNAVLQSRPDLPIERAQRYDALIKQQNALKMRIIELEQKKAVDFYPSAGGAASWYAQNGHLFGPNVDGTGIAFDDPIDAMFIVSAVRSYLWNVHLIPDKEAGDVKKE